MEILINAHRAGFAQGFSKLSCRKRLGKHMLAREVLTVTWWVLCSALAHELTFPSAFFPSLCLATPSQWTGCLLNVSHGQGCW